MSCFDVSVIVPAYNVDEYICRAVDSVLSQEGPSCEVVVVNDGSTDATAASLSKYEDDPRVTIINQPNSGVSVARNAGIEIARGKWCAFLDGDDWLLPGAMDKLFQASLHNENNLIAGSHLQAKFSRSGELVLNNAFPNARSCEVDVHEAMLSCFKSGELCLQSSCFKLFDIDLIRNNKLHFLPGVTNKEDGHFVFSYLKCAAKVIYIGAPVFVVFERSDSVTRSVYDSRWLTGFEAFARISDLCVDDDDLKTSMNVATADFSISLLARGLQVSGVPREDISCLRQHIRQYGLRNLGKNSISWSMQFLVFKHAPIFLLKAYARIKRRLKRIMAINLGA